MATWGEEAIFANDKPKRNTVSFWSDSPLYPMAVPAFVPTAPDERPQTSNPKKSWQETSFIVGAPPASALTANFPWEFWQKRKPFPLTQTWSDSPLAPMSAQALTANFPWGVAEFWQTKKPQKSSQDAVFASILPISAAAISLQWNQALDPSSPLKRQIYPAFNAPLAPPSLAPTLPLVAAEFWQTSKPSRPPREGVFFIWNVTQLAASIIWGWEAQFSVPRYHLGMQLDGFNNFVSQPTPYPNLSILIIGDFSPTSLIVYDYNGAVDLCG